MTPTPRHKARRPPGIGDAFADAMAADKARQLAELDGLGGLFAPAEPTDGEAAPPRPAS